MSLHKFDTAEKSQSLKD